VWLPVRLPVWFVELMAVFALSPVAILETLSFSSKTELMYKLSEDHTFSRLINQPINQSTSQSIESFASAFRYRIVSFNIRIKSTHLAIHLVTASTGDFNTFSLPLSVSLYRSFCVSVCLGFAVQQRTQGPVGRRFQQRLLRLGFSSNHGWIGHKHITLSRHTSPH